MLLRAEGEGVDVDAGVGGAGVGVVRLHDVEVAALALREAILAVELELGSDDGVLAPAVKLEGGLGEHEGAGVRNVGLDGGARTAVIVVTDREVRGRVRSAAGVGTGKLVHTFFRRCFRGRNVPHLVEVDAGAVHGTGSLEETRSVNERIVPAAFAARRNRLRAAERMNGVGERINGVGVVERLGTEGAVQERTAVEGRAVVDVIVGLHHPDELLDGVVEVELDLVGGGADGLITSELELLDEVLVGVLGHAAALVGVEEDVVDVEGGSDEGLVVRGLHLDALGGGLVARKVRNGPEALVDRAKINVDANLVVLKGNEGKGKTRVLAEPELKGNVEGGLGEGVARGANLAGGVGHARAVDRREGRIGNVGELSGVADHGVVRLLLVDGLGKLVPDVHPVAELAVDALAADLNLNLRDELLTREVEPAGVDAGVGRIGGGVGHGLVDLRQGDLKDGGVRKVTVARDGAGHAAAEIGLTVEGLLDGLHREVGVAAVCDLPEGNLGVAGKVNVLCAVSYELHQTTSHCFILSLKKKILGKNSILKIGDCLTFY